MWENPISSFCKLKMLAFRVFAVNLSKMIATSFLSILLITHNDIILKLVQSTMISAGFVPDNWCSLTQLFTIKSETFYLSL